MFFDEDVRFNLGEALEVGLPEGVDKALRKFKRGERSLVQLHRKWGFGKAGKPEWGLPPDARLEFDIELRNFEKVMKEAFSKSTNTYMFVFSLASRRLNGLTPPHPT